jgi:putative FmdB family regulatory protein
MPIYEYKCQSCSGVLEVIQKFSDEPLTIHEGCGGALERLIGSPALQFKGSGWYVNDYAKSGKSKGGSNGKSAEAKTESTTESKAETKKSESSSTPAAGTSKKAE